MSYNKSNVVKIDRKENHWDIVEFAIPMDHHNIEMEEGEIDKYMSLATKLRMQSKVKTVFVPIV